MEKFLCLGNEFVDEDSLAVELGKILRDEGFETLHVRDSFSLMSVLSEDGDFVILDVVENLKDVCLIGVEDLRVDSILSAHDFDAGYVLKLLGEDVRIIGIPMIGDVLEIKDKILEIIAK